MFFTIIKCIKDVKCGGSFMIVIGEKLNSSIPSVFKAFEERDTEKIRSLVSLQLEAGAEYLDVNGAACMEKELDTLLWASREALSLGAKLMVDSPNGEIIHHALSELNVSDVIVNSVTLESDRFDSTMQAVEKFGAKIVALPISDSGIPQDAESRINLSVELIEKIKERGVPCENIFLDVLIQTLGTDHECGRVALDTIRAIRAKYPDVHIIGGLSNVSFGLPKRAVINGAFLSAAITCGLDAAIMDNTNADLRLTMRAALLANGYDEYCMDYLDTYRAIYPE